MASPTATALLAPVSYYVKYFPGENVFYTIFSRKINCFIFIFIFLVLFIIIIIIISFNFFFWDPKIFFLLFFFSTLGQRYPYISKWVFLGQMDNKQKGFILYVFAKFLIRMVRIVVKRRWELIICGAWSWGEQCIFCSNH